MRKLILAASLLSVGVVASEQSPDIEVLRGEAQSLVRQFVGQLKPQLQQAMQEGGPVQAIPGATLAQTAIAWTGPPSCIACCNWGFSWPTNWRTRS